MECLYCYIWWNGSWKCYSDCTCRQNVSRETSSESLCPLISSTASKQLLRGRRRYVIGGTLQQQQQQQQLIDSMAQFQRRRVTVKCKPHRKNWSKVVQVLTASRSKQVHRSGVYVSSRWTPLDGACRECAELDRGSLRRERHVTYIVETAGRSIGVNDVRTSEYARYAPL